MAQEKKETKPETISPSALSSYLRCGILYYRSYIKKEKMPPKFVMIQGTGLHSGVEVAMKHKMATGQAAPLDLAINAAVESLHKEMDNRAKLIQDTKFNPDGDDAEGPNDVESMVIRGVQSFYAEAEPSLMPLEAETWIRLPINGSTRVLTGRKDLVTKEIIDFEGRILGDDKAVLDTKFSKNKPTPEFVLQSPQLLTYFIAQKAEDGGKAPKQIGIVGVSKAATPKINVAIVEPPPDAEARILRTITRVCHAIDSGIFLPAAPPMFAGGFNHCSPRSCGYWSSCKDRLCGLKIYD